MRIIVEGPQGSGKTNIINKLIIMLNKDGKKSCVLYDRPKYSHSKYRKQYDVIIIERQGDK